MCVCVSFSHIASQGDKSSEVALTVTNDDAVAEKFAAVQDLLLNGDWSYVLSSLCDQYLLDTPSDVQVAWSEWVSGCWVGE